MIDINKVMNQILKSFNKWFNSWLLTFYGPDRPKLPVEIVDLLNNSYFDSQFFLLFICHKDSNCFNDNNCFFLVMS